MLTLKNKSFDEDFPSVQKKKSRSKKPRDKFSLMMVIPMKVLSHRDETTSGGKIKRGKRFGFTVYDALSCKSCKPNKFFHKRLGLSVHNRESHGKNSNFKVPNLPERSFSLPTAAARSRRTTAGGMPVKSFSSLNRRRDTFEVKPKTDPNAVIECIDIDLDNETTNAIDEDEIEVLEDDAYEVANNNETKLPSPMKKPVLENGRNKRSTNKTKKKNNKKSIDDTSDDSDSDIECIEIVEVNENRVKSFQPKDYRWMESSHMYQPKVWLACDLNKKIRESVDQDEELVIVDDINPLYASNLSTYLDENDVVVEVDDTVASDEIADDDVELLGNADPVNLDEAVFDNSSHVRNLFEEENAQQNKRKPSVARSSPSKRIKSVHQDEMLLYEDPEDEEDVPDITSMLEVSMEEPNVNDDEIELVELDETCHKEQIMVDVDESKDIEVVSLDDDEQDSMTETKVPEKHILSKPRSIQDLVGIWGSEETHFTTGKKSRRKEPRGL